MLVNMIKSMYFYSSYSNLTNTVSCHFIINKGARFCANSTFPICHFRTLQEGKIGTLSFTDHDQSERCRVHLFVTLFIIIYINVRRQVLITLILRLIPKSHFTLAV